MNLEKLVLDFDQDYSHEVDKAPNPNWQYLRVVPVDDPDTAPAKSWRPQMRWCHYHWGSGSDSFDDATWHFRGNGWFEFECDRDAALFLLKWS